MSHCSFHFNPIVGYCSECQMVICNTCLSDHVTHLTQIIIFKKTQGKMKMLTQKIEQEWNCKARKFIEMRKDIQKKKQEAINYYDILLQDTQKQELQLQETEIAKLRRKIRMYNTELYNDLQISDIRYLQELSEGKHSIPKAQQNIEAFIKTFNHSLTGFGKSNFKRQKTIQEFTDLQQAARILKEGQAFYIKKQFDKAVRLYQSGFSVFIKQVEEQFGFYFYEHYEAYQEVFQQAKRRNIIDKAKNYQSYTIFQNSSLVASTLNKRRQLILESLARGFTSLQRYQASYEVIKKNDVLLQKFSDKGHIAYLKAVIKTRHYDQGIKNLAQISVSEVKKNKTNVLSNSPVKSYLIGELYLETNQPFIAQNYIRNLENITKQNIVFNQSRLVLGKMHAMRGQHDKALHFLDQCNQISEPSQHYISNSGLSFIVQLTVLKLECLKALNKPQLGLKNAKEITVLNKVKENHQNLAALQLAKASLYSNPKQIASKEECIAKALQLKPNHQKANLMRNQLVLQSKVAKKSVWCIR